MSTFWSELTGLARRISAQALAEIRSRQDWEQVRLERRREFLEMMGLGILPERCDLSVQDCGALHGPGYRIEKISFQSLPDVRVTGTLYIPEGLKGPAPAVLYACGHAHSGTFQYQTHGDLWARRGYVCLVYNTLEQADCLESGGDHHGLHSGRRLDWISLGYTAAGGELWNSIRALDFLVSRPEVDADRVGITGGSGGGALSWWVAIADDRIRASAPVCGTSTIGSFIGERTLNEHCDCFFYHNLFRRDIADVGALIAPRPLLVCSAIHDSLFHPDSYREVVAKLKRLYGLYGCAECIDLCEYPGGHGYSARGHEALEAWFDRHVAGDERPLLQPAPRRFTEKELAIHGGAPPASDRMAMLPEILSPRGVVPIADTAAELAQSRARLIAELRRTTFRHFPQDPPPLAHAKVGSWVGVEIHDFTTEEETRLRLWCYDAWEQDKKDMVLGIMSPEDTVAGMCEKIHGFHNGPLAVLEPRGTGALSWHPSQDLMLTRASLLVGRTPESVRVWDILRGLQALRQRDPGMSQRVFLYGQGISGVLAMHAALQDEGVAGVLAESPPVTHADGPHLLGVLRVLDVPHLAGLLAPRLLGLVHVQSRQLHWASKQYARLECDKQLRFAPSMHYIARDMLA